MDDRILDGKPAILCPFCRADVAPLFEGAHMVDSPVQCLRCLAALLFSSNLDDPGHPERLAGVLLEFLPEGDTACRLETRRVLDVASVPAANGVQRIHLLAGWNLEELVSPVFAAGILGLERAQVDALLHEGVIPEAVKGPEPRSRFERPRWLIPRSGLLAFIDARGAN